MNLLKTFEKKHAKKSVPELKSGDVVRVHETIKEGKKERIQIFEGVVISMRGGKGLNATFTVRKISLGVAVEKTFPLHLPSIIKIEKIKKIRSRRSKLYYLRNLTDKQIRKRSELVDFTEWKDAKAVEEEEKLKVEKEEAAKKKEEEEKKKEEEAQKAVEAAKAAHAENK